jgi:hypothetical protein
MVALVGEQTIPNLLPMRYCKPEAVVLVYTKQTESRARRLQTFLTETSDTEVYPLEIQDAYRVAEIRHCLQEVLAGHPDLLFNLTGGTKTMAFAAYDLARQSRSPFLYFQTEGPHGRDQRSFLYRYAWQGDEAELEACIELSEALITLDDYLRAHFDGYKITGFSTDQGGILERAIYAALKEYVDEIMAGVRPYGMKDQIEIDLAVRCGNQVGFIEVKRGGGESGKRAVDQLTTAAARELSGTYTARFIVTGITQDEQYKAMANALNIMVIELSEWRWNRRSLSTSDAQRLRQAIAQRLPYARRVA